VKAGGWRREAGVRIGHALLLLVIWAAPAFAEFNDIITGARPAGMGNAFVALADDVNALYWNPAGLTLQKHVELGFMHADELDPTSGPSIGTDFLGATSGHGPFGAVGLSFLRQGLSDIYQERTLALSYGYALNPFTRVGLNLKSMAVVVRPQGRFFPDPALNDDSTQGLDLSLIHIVTPDLRFGALARNLLARIGHVDRAEVHDTYRVGAAYRLHTELLDEDYVWFTFDLFSKEDIDDEAGLKIKNAIGLEYQITPWIAVRAGANNGRFTGGAGLSALGLSVDYAIAEEENEGLGTSQRLSITYRFGGTIVKERREVTVRHRAPPPPKARLEKPPPKKKRSPEG
jgi:hypothetical protein